MKKIKNQAGFTLVELAVIVVLIALVGIGFGLIFNRKAKLYEDRDTAATAAAGAENALEILSNLPNSRLPSGGTFRLEADNKISITGSCETTSCDWLVIPGNRTDSLVKGMTYQTAIPEGKTVLLRRWLIEDVNAELGLKRITVVVAADANSELPISIFTAVRGKSNSE